MNNKKILRLLVIVFCLYLIVTTVKSIFDLWNAGDKLTIRQDEIKALQRQREDLLRKKASIDNPQYWEKVARDKLGLTKPGDEVIIIPQELLADNSKVVTKPAIPNWQKWARLLF